ncbi:MAG: FAD-dependent oxidoreductase [Acidobacteriota bacterium]
MSVPGYDVVIAGAGIVGAACAAECAAAGLKVAVLESETVGSGATGAGMGHIVVMDDSEAQFALGRYSQKLWQGLSERLPASCEYQACGTLWLASDQEEMEEARRKGRYYGQRHVEAEILDPQALAQAEPALRPGLAGALRVPGDSVLYPPSAARFLIDQAQQRGAQLRVGQPVTELTGSQARLADGTLLAAGCTVNAAGSGALQITPQLREWVRPRKGHLAITDRYPGLIRHQLVELGYLKSAHASEADSVAFNLQPRPTGQLLIGSSRQFNAPDLSVEAPLLGRMLRRACRYVPRLADLSVIRAWTGWRAATRDHLPLIGPCPGLEGLYLATGHEGLGITTSLGTARLLTDQILGRSSEIPPPPYLPSRMLQEVPK